MCHLQRHTGFHHAIAESPDDFGNGTVKDAVISVLPQVPATMIAMTVRPRGGRPDVQDPKYSDDAML